MKCFQKIEKKVVPVVVPLHKIESKNLIKNYQSITLLPIFNKIFERLVFNIVHLD